MRFRMRDFHRGLTCFPLFGALATTSRAACFDDDETKKREVMLQRRRALQIERAARSRINRQENDKKRELINNMRTQTLHDEIVKALEVQSIAYAEASRRGKRRTMEDATQITCQQLCGSPLLFFGIYDGHGGVRTSSYLARKLHVNIFFELARLIDRGLEPNFFDAIDSGCVNTDTEILLDADLQHDLSGSTAIFVLAEKGRLFFGGVGDSQAVVSSGGRAVNVCTVHKPSHPEERMRILEAGAQIKNERLGGMLAISRAFGDRAFKLNGQNQSMVDDEENRQSFSMKTDAVICKPDVVSHLVDDSDEFFVLACDGLFDVMEPQEVVDFLHQRLHLKRGECFSQEELQAAADELVEYAIHQKGSNDNVSAIVVAWVR